MMVMADNIADLFDQIFPGAQFGQDLSGNRRAFFLLVAGGRALVFPFRLMDADIVQIGADRITAGLPFSFLASSSA